MTYFGYYEFAYCALEILQKCQKTNEYVSCSKNHYHVEWFLK